MQFYLDGDVSGEVNMKTHLQKKMYTPCTIFDRFVTYWEEAVLIFTKMSTDVMIALVIMFVSVLAAKVTRESIRFHCVILSKHKRDKI